MKLSHILNEAAYQNTYSGWKAACRRTHPGCGFRGDKDIGAATLNGRDVGEWDGEKGEVFAPVKESVESASSEETNRVALQHLEDELSHMPKNPQTQKEYDMIDKLKQKIKRLKAGLQ